VLQTMPMIGPVTALGFVAALDDVARFDGPLRAMWRSNAPYTAARLRATPPSTIAA
jgi:hypothetical protein